MFEPNVYDTGDSLIISRSFWLRILCVPVCLFFFCCTLAALASPFFVIVNGYTLENKFVAIALAVLCGLPTILFWYGSQPLEIRIDFHEGYYEMRRGFRRFTRFTRGNFTEIDHLTIWSKQENRYAVSYTTSLTWKNKRLPFTLRVICNDQQDALDWANNIAQKLSVPLYTRLGA